LKIYQNFGIFGEKHPILVKKLENVVKNHNGGPLEFLKQNYKNFGQKHKGDQGEKF
jgi:hypothetical protein